MNAGKLSDITRAAIRLLCFSIAGVSAIAFAQDESPIQPTSPLQQESQAVFNPAKLVANWRTAGFKFEDKWKTVTKAKDAKQWGIAFEQAVVAEDLASMVAQVEFQPILDRCVGGISDNDFQKGFTIGVKTETSQMLTAFSNPNNRYTFLGTRDTEFGPGVMFRFIDANGGCNYHLWRLMKNGDGVVVGVDIYIYLLGETLSDTMRRMAVLFAPQKDPSLLKRLRGKDLEFAKHQKEMLNLVQNFEAQRFDEALTSFEKLPPTLQKEKPLMLMRTQAAIQVDEEAYLKGLKEFQQQYPNDASVDLISIDMHFLNQDFEKLHEALNRLEQAIGTDAHLLSLQSGAYMGQGNTAQAIESLQAAIALEPETQRLYLSLLEVSLAAEDFDIVLATLKKLSQRYKIREFDFEANPVYAGFVKSKQHQQFQKFLTTLDKEPTLKK